MNTRYTLIVFAATVLLSFLYSPLSAQTLQKDSLALIHLYEATDGLHWKNKTGWNGSKPIKYWYGIETKQVGDSLRVVEIKLPNNNLNGLVKDSLLVATGNGTETENVSVSYLDSLSYLEVLDLSNNDLYGGMPLLSKTFYLKRLQLNGNTLEGSIPPLNNFQHLSRLNLSNNNLSGNLPAMSNLQELQRVFLQNNQLTGGIPNLNNTLELKVLALQNNQLNSNTSNLSEIAQCVYLEKLYLQNNDNLQGGISQLSKLIGLEEANISHTSISGTLPNLDDLQNLEELHIHHTNLSGQIPNLSFLTKLEILDLNNNELTGTIPPLDKLTVLQKIKLNNNTLTGSFPEFSDDSPIQVVKAAYNNLSGNLNNFQKALIELDTLSLKQNFFSGTVPNFGIYAGNLRYLDLSFNALEGAIPAISSTKLRYLNLRNNNNLTNGIPNFNLKNLRHLDLSNNFDIKGTLPNFSSSKKLVTLKLAGMGLNGDVPSLCHLKDLETIDLHQNYFEGGIPDFTCLQQIDTALIHTNKFTFEGLEENVEYHEDNSSFRVFEYSPQDFIQFEIENDTLFRVHVGGSPENVTYRWFRNVNDQILIKEAKENGDNTLIMKGGGYYSVVATNKAAKDLVLRSKTVFHITHDDCIDALDIDLIPEGMYSYFTTVNSTLEEGQEPFAGCFESDNNVWFRFVGDGSAYTFTATECEDNHVVPVPTLEMAAFTGSCGNMQKVACSSTPIMNLLTEPGKIYYLMVDGQEGMQTDFCLHLKQSGTCEAVIDGNVVHIIPPSVVIGVKDGESVADEVLESCAGEQLILKANETSGYPGFVNYLWSAGPETNELWITESGTYSVTVSDQYGCSSSDEVEVLVKDNPIPQIAGTPKFCEGSSTHLFVIPPEEGIYQSFEWSSGEKTESIEVHHTDWYSVVTTYENGCTAESEELRINDVPGPDGAIELWQDGELLTNKAFCEGDLVTLRAFVLPNEDSNEFLWSNGATTPSIDITESGTYSVEITDANGCSFEAQAMIEPLPVPEVFIAGDAVFCSSTVLDAGEHASYSWNTGETTRQIEVFSEGVYTVEVRNESGCWSSASKEVARDNETCPCDLYPKFNLASQYCIEQFLDFNQHLSENTTTGGEWEIILPDGSSMFSPNGFYAFMEAGLYEVIYRLQSDICTEEHREEVLINSPPDANWSTESGELQFCAADLPIPLKANDENGIWICGANCDSEDRSCLQYIDGQLYFNPSLSGQGLENFEVSYQIESGACTVCNTQTIGIQWTPLEPPIVSIGEQANCGEKIEVVVIEDSNTFEGNPHTFNIYDANHQLFLQNMQGPAFYFDPQPFTSETGSHTFYVTSTNGTCESDATEIRIENTGSCCETDAGTMPKDLQILCADEEAIAVGSGSSLGGEEGSLLTYILHTRSDDTMGQLLAVHPEGIFKFEDISAENAAYNTTYYISAIVGIDGSGDNSADGIPDLEASCTKIAEGTPIVFLAPIEIQSVVVCEENSEQYRAKITIEGGLPSYDPSKSYALNINGNNVFWNPQNNPTYTTSWLGIEENFEVSASDSESCKKELVITGEACSDPCEQLDNSDIVVWANNELIAGNTVTIPFGGSIDLLALLDNGLAAAFEWESVNGVSDGNALHRTPTNTTIYTVTATTEENDCILKRSITVFIAEPTCSDLACESFTESLAISQAPLCINEAFNIEVNEYQKGDCYAQTYLVTDENGTFTFPPATSGNFDALTTEGVYQMCALNYRIEDLDFNSMDELGDLSGCHDLKCLTFEVINCNPSCSDLPCDAFTESLAISQAPLCINEAFNIEVNEYQKDDCYSQTYLVTDENGTFTFPPTASGNFDALTAEGVYQMCALNYRIEDLDFNSMDELGDLSGCHDLKCLTFEVINCNPSCSDLPCDAFTESLAISQAPLCINEAFSIEVNDFQKDDCYAQAYLVTDESGAFVFPPATSGNFDALTTEGTYQMCALNYRIEDLDFNSMDELGDLSGCHELKCLTFEVTDCPVPCSDLPCNPFTESLAISQAPLCINEAFSIEVEDYQTDDCYTQTYLVTDENGTFVSPPNENGDFEALTDEGFYQMCALNYRTEDIDLSAAHELSDLSGCHVLKCLVFEVADCTPICSDSSCEPYTDYFPISQAPSCINEAFNIGVSDYRDDECYNQTYLVTDEGGTFIFPPNENGDFEALTDEGLYQMCALNYKINDFDFNDIDELGDLLGCHALKCLTFEVTDCEVEPEPCSKQAGNVIGSKTLGLCETACMSVNSNQTDEAYTTYLLLFNETEILQEQIGVSGSNCIDFESIVETGHYTFYSVNYRTADFEVEYPQGLFEVGTTTVEDMKALQIPENCYEHSESFEMEVVHLDAKEVYFCEEGPGVPEIEIELDDYEEGIEVCNNSTSLEDLEADYHYILTDENQQILQNGLSDNVVSLSQNAEDYPSRIYGILHTDDVNPPIAGMYLEDLEGCFDLSDNFVRIRLEEPCVVFPPEDVYVCGNSLSILDEQEGVDYHWYRDEALTDFVDSGSEITVNHPHTYYVISFVEEDCVSEALAVNVAAERFRAESEHECDCEPSMGGISRIFGEIKGGKAPYSIRIKIGEDIIEENDVYDTVFSFELPIPVQVNSYQLKITDAMGCEKPYNIHSSCKLPCGFGQMMDDDIIKTTFLQLPYKMEETKVDLALIVWKDLQSLPEEVVSLQDEWWEELELSWSDAGLQTTCHEDYVALEDLEIVYDNSHPELYAYIGRDTIDFEVAFGPTTFTKRLVVDITAPDFVLGQAVSECGTAEFCLNEPMMVIDRNDTVDLARAVELDWEYNYQVPKVSADWRKVNACTSLETGSVYDIWAQLKNQETQEPIFHGFNVRDCFNQIKTPSSELPEVSIQKLCDGNRMELSALMSTSNQQVYDFEWSTGEVSSSISIEDVTSYQAQSEEYWVKATHGDCEAFATTTAAVPIDVDVEDTDKAYCTAELRISGSELSGMLYDSKTVDWQKMCEWDDLTDSYLCSLSIAPSSDNIASEVAVTDHHGCESSIEVFPCSPQIDIVSENPAPNRFEVEITGVPQEMPISYHVFGVDGRLWMTSKTSTMYERDFVLELDERFIPGVYIVQFIVGEGEFGAVKKLVKTGK